MADDCCCRAVVLTCVGWAGGSLLLCSKQNESLSSIMSIAVGIAHCHVHSCLTDLCAWLHQLPIAASYNLRARLMHFDCRLKSGVLKELGSRYSRRQAVVVEEHVDSSQNGRPARCPQMQFGQLGVLRSNSVSSVSSEAIRSARCPQKQFDQLGVLRSSRPLLVETPIIIIVIDKINVVSI